MLAVAEDAVAKVTARRDRLAQRRKVLGLTQEDLAGLLDVERTTVVRWERGETQPLPWIRPKLARALKVRPERMEALLAGDDPASPDAAALAIPRQLPAAAADFTGRAGELAELTRLLDRAGSGVPGTVVISAIGGTAGVGKTALALYWAHRVAGRFPDGQLHVNLRGFDPSGTPAAPAEAVRQFLNALGVPPERIPPDPEAQTGLYRGLLADKRMLIVLDNAWDERQVRPLLPASPGCLVLVTSRNQLAGLAATDGARLLSLDVLSHAEAVHLLTARIGASRTAVEPAAVDEIADLCACLPLALAVAAARAIARSGFPLAVFAGELRKSASRLDALTSGDPAASVRAVFSWSYRQLSEEAARMFRLLGLHPGPDISVPATASLAAVAEPDARRLLRELTRAHLISEHVPGRYTFHDLLRAYAAALARDTDSKPECDKAIVRVLGHYLHTAGPGSALLRPTREPVALDPQGTGSVPERLAEHSQALAWFEAEQQVLLAVVGLAARSESGRQAWQLPWAMSPFLQAHGHYQDWAATQRMALTAATRLGDVAGQAVSSNQLGAAYVNLGDYDQAHGCYMSSLELYRRLGDTQGEVKVHQSLTELAARQDRYIDALGHAEEALRLCRAVGDSKRQEAEILNDVGWCHVLLGDYGQARTFCRASLNLAAEAGSRFAEYHAWDTLGYAEHQLGNFDEAATCYQRALSLCREIHMRPNEAEILTHIGDTYYAAGDLPRCRDAWQQALAILEDMQHPDAEKVCAKLASFVP